MTEKQASRRNVLYGAAAAGVAAPLLAACGSGSGSSADVAGAPSAAPSSPASSGGSGSAGEAPAGAIDTADIPVGGGAIFPDEKLVVTQPTAGEFKAFSAVCTHTGCLVSGVADGSINCECHFSKFSISDGSVQGGPASSPLPEKSVSVSGSSLTIT